MSDYSGTPDIIDRTWALSQRIPVHALSSPSSQQWTKTGSRIEHIASHLCLDTDMFGDGSENGREIVVNPCESSLMSQHWDLVSS